MLIGSIPLRYQNFVSDNKAFIVREEWECIRIDFVLLHLPIFYKNILVHFKMKKRMANDDLTRLNKKPLSYIFF